MENRTKTHTGKEPKNPKKKSQGEDPHTNTVISQGEVREPQDECKTRSWQPASTMKERRSESESSHAKEKPQVEEQMVVAGFLNFSVCHFPISDCLVQGASSHSVHRSTALFCTSHVQHTTLL